MTKEDYMKLDKERLAELLEQRDAQMLITPQIVPQFIPSWNYCPISGGMCTNPFHDCVNCPHHATGFYTTSTNNTKINEK